MSNQKVRVRFAPSPTGKLHVGGARTAIYNWAFARAQNGTFILRIDDTDPTRSTEENTKVILRALRWLGLDWDEGPDKDGPAGPYRQTECLDIYRDAAHKLYRDGKAYPCFCTPQQLEKERKSAQERKDSFQGYPRTCRDMDPDEAAALIASGTPYTLRIKVPDDRGDVIIDDAVHGKVIFNAKELDDFVIFRSDNTPTYNFATVVDDARMGITHVIRGDDHLSNTPRQIVVYEALHAPVPVFAHISMILGADGKKLSKRHGATSVEDYRDAGYWPDAFVNYLALLGWSLDGETTIVPRATLAKAFSLDHVSKNPATFDPKKLDWMNSTYYASLSDREFAQAVMVPQLERAHLIEPAAYDNNSEWYNRLASILKPRTKRAPDVVEKARFLFEGDVVTLDRASAVKHLAHAHAQPWLDEAARALSAIEESAWKSEAIDAALMPLPEKLTASKSKFYGTLRVAICGNQVSPPLGESLELLGRSCALARIANAINLDVSSLADADTSN